MGQDGERRKTYAAAVIDEIKGNSTIYVGDSLVGVTDTILSKGKDVVVCLPGIKNRACDSESRADHGKRKWRVHTDTHRDEQRRQGSTDSGEVQMPTEEDEATRVGQIILSGILPVFGNMIRGYRNSKRMPVNGMVRRLCKEDEVGYVDVWDSFVGKGEMYARDGLHLS